MEIKNIYSVSMRDRSCQIKKAINFCAVALYKNIKIIIYGNRQYNEVTSEYSLTKYIFNGPIICNISKYEILKFQYSHYKSKFTVTV